MVKTAIADDYLLHKLAKISENANFSIGLILGQPTFNRDYVIHFAKTPPLQEESKSGAIKEIKSINDISEEWVADHAKQATRMLPGGMCVLGIFVVCSEDVLNPFNIKLKSILTKTHQLLESNKYLYGNTDNTEKMAFYFCTNTLQFTCKVYDVRKGAVKPVEFKFVPDAMKWNQVECKFQIDQIYQIGDNETDWPLKKHMGLILDQVDNNLQKSIYLFDGEIKGVDDSLEGVGKKKKVSRSSKDDQEKPIQVTILQPCDADEKLNTFKVSESSNQIRILGQVACKLFLNPKVSIGAASQAMMRDIMRSISTRLEMHWDSLTEEEHGEDINSVHEPPRRVLIALPNSKVTISDYLFPGEGAQDAQVSSEEILDIKIHTKTDIEEVEGQADLSDYYNEALLESENEEAITKSVNEKGKSLHLIALGVAVLILIMSLVIHFIQV